MCFQVENEFVLKAIYKVSTPRISKAATRRPGDSACPDYFFPKASLTNKIRLIAGVMGHSSVRKDKWEFAGVHQAPHREVVGA